MPKPYQKSGNRRFAALKRPASRDVSGIAHLCRDRLVDQLRGVSIFNLSTLPVFIWPESQAKNSVALFSSSAPSMDHANGGSADFDQKRTFELVILPTETSPAIRMLLREAPVGDGARPLDRRSSNETLTTDIALAGYSWQGTETNARSRVAPEASLRVDERIVSRTAECGGLLRWRGLHVDADRGELRVLLDFEAYKCIQLRTNQSQSRDQQYQAPDQ
ncbi:hypothetical protein [Bradyrhizobium sp. DASA03030]